MNKGIESCICQEISKGYCEDCLRSNFRSWKQLVKQLEQAVKRLGCWGLVWKPPIDNGSWNYDKKAANGRRWVSPAVHSLATLHLQMKIRSYAFEYTAVGRSLVSRPRAVSEIWSTKFCFNFFRDNLWFFCRSSTRSSLIVDLPKFFEVGYFET